MKHAKHFFALLAVLTIAATLGCSEKENDHHAGNTNPRQSGTHVSLVGTTWGCESEVDGTIDKTVLHFVTDSTGSEHDYLSSNGHVLADATTDFVYHFDGLTLAGTIRLNLNFAQEEAFTYHPADTSLSYIGHVFHLMEMSNKHSAVNL